MVRAKFRCDEILQHSAYTDSEGVKHESRTVKMDAVSDDGGDNESWSEATPSGKLEMTINNPSAFDTFVINGEYYLDITPVEKAQGGKGVA